MRLLAAWMLLTSVTLAAAQSIPPPPPPPPPSAMTAPAAIGSPHMCPEDQYPVSAMQTGAEGRTILGFKITPQGNVRDVGVIVSSGNQDLDNAAATCAAQWIYRPAKQDGVAVQSNWKAAVVWKIQATPPFSDIAEAARECVLRSNDGRDELQKASLHTVTRVHFSNGLITQVAIVGSSGIPDLDQRVADCYRGLPAELTASISSETDTLFAMYAPGS
jgi:TonB family protein